LALLGIFVVLRRMAFFSDGIAHASLAGVALGVLAGANPLLTALGLSTILAVIMAWMERSTKIASDAIVGLIFTAGMASGVIMLSFKRGYQPELVSFLFGNILAIQWIELWMIVLLSALIIIFILVRYRRLALMILNPELARLSGVPVAVYQTLLYVIVSVAVVLSIKMLGIVLVSALLIVPVSTAKLFAPSFHSLMAWSVVLAEVTVLCGILLSVYLNLPTGATIVLCGFVLFVFTMAVHGKGRPQKNTARS
jgi:zinc transport system permease protein